MEGELSSNALPTKLTIGVGETYTIKGAALGKSPTYESAKKKVATVSAKGKITAVGAGAAVAMYESWSADACHDYIFGLPAGEYTLKVLSTN